MAGASVDQSSYSNLDLVRDLWRWLGKHRWPYAAATVTLTVSEILQLYPAYVFAKIINVLTAGQAVDAPLVWRLVGFWTVASLLRYVTRQIAKYFAYQIGERMQIETEQLAVQHMLSLDIAWHERESVGSKMRKVYRGAGSVEQVLDLFVDRGLPSAVSFIGAVWITGAVDPLIGGFMVVFLVSYLWLSQRLGRNISAAITAVSQGEEDVGGLEYEAMGNIRTVRALGFGDTMLRRIRQLNDTLFQKVIRRIGAWRSRDLAIDSWGQLCRLALLVYVLAKVLSGAYAAGFLVLTYNYFSDVWRAIGALSDQALRFVAARNDISRMVQLLDEPVGIDARGTKSFPRDWQTLSLRNVSFSYGDRTVLRDVSFDVQRGERIGIVGLSGAGKSTLFKLLLKEYDDYQGKIAVGSASLHDIKRQSFVARVAVVLQDTEVFNFPLKENVTIADPKQAKNDKRLMQALKIAHVTDYLDRLPDGMDTLIGEKGVKLSGGERQRLGIARAVYKQPDILLMDEATSHLDSESEQKIQASLHQVFKSVTAIVIAHRLSTIREMDRILVLEDGRLIEEGGFDALINKKGRFYRLWQTQQF